MLYILAFNVYLSHQNKGRTCHHSVKSVHDHLVLRVFLTKEEGRRQL